MKGQSELIERLQKESDHFVNLWIEETETLSYPYPELDGTEESRLFRTRFVESLLTVLRNGNPNAVNQLSQEMATIRAKQGLPPDLVLRRLLAVRQAFWRWMCERYGNSPALILEAMPRLDRILDEIVGVVGATFVEEREKVIAEQALGMEELGHLQSLLDRTVGIQMKIPCKKEFVTAVRNQAKVLARRFGFSEEEVADVQMGVGEAADNAIEYGFSPAGVDVFYQFSGDTFLVEIMDYGRGFDPTGRGETLPDLFAERGRGIFIMKQMMDDVEIRSHPNLGSRILLSKSRRKPRE
ncbi:MAG: ATP-binding protein [Armatimonadetes bacterium]|nr:ATP-binding protein [Armatimonadota bacterium]